MRGRSLRPKSRRPTSTSGSGAFLPPTADRSRGRSGTVLHRPKARLLPAPGARRSTRTHFVDHPHFDVAAEFQMRTALRDFNRLVEVGRFDTKVSTDDFLRLGVRTVGDNDFTTAGAQDLARTLRQLVARDVTSVLAHL